MIPYVLADFLGVRPNKYTLSGIHNSYSNEFDLSTESIWYLLFIKEGVAQRVAA